jgi:hypothetical protein
MANLIRLKQIESGSQLQTSANVGNDFSGAVYEIIDAAGLISSSAQVDLLQASNYDEFVVQLDVTMSSDLERNIVSASISQSISILSNTYVTTASLFDLSSSIATTDSASQHLISQLSTSIQATTGDFSASVAQQFSSSYATIYSISSSINTSISSSDATFVAFSSSIDDTILNKMNVVGVISSSTQLTGATLKGITIAPVDSDSYSLIVSGAVAIVDATGLQDGGFGDNDATVPAQIYLDGNATTASVSPPPDPSTAGQANSNMIDMGEF